MLKEIEAVRTKLQKKIEEREAKLNGLMDWCKDRYDVNWYGYQKYQDEYAKRSAKLEKELKQYQFWYKQLYEMHLAAVEAGIEDGTHAELVYLGMVPEDDQKGDE